MSKNQRSSQGSSSMFHKNRSFRFCRNTVIQNVDFRLKTQLPEKVKEICPKFMCQRNLKAPHDCQSVVCPKGFRSIPDRRKRGCDSGCVPISPAERICSLSGRVLVTFDGLEYKYDVWDHALVMSLTNDTWYIVG